MSKLRVRGKFGGSGGGGGGGGGGGTGQHPTLLDGYAHRPPWQVAGVDFYVGCPIGQVLQEISSGTIPPGTVITGGNLLRITQDNVTVDGYHFINHALYIAANVTGSLVKNCLFEGKGFQADGTVLGNLEIHDCTFDGLATLYNPITLLNTGTKSVHHCWIKNTVQHFCEVGNSSRLTYTYNMLEEGGQWDGQGAIPHLNFLQMFSNQDGPVIVQYNTILQHKQATAGEGLQGAGINADFSYNTLIAASTPGNESVSYLMHLNFPANPCSGIITNNYFDKTGAFGAFYPGVMTPPAFTSSGNIDMVTGAILTPS